MSGEDPLGAHTTPHLRLYPEVEARVCGGDGSAGGQWAWVKMHAMELSVSQRRAIFFHWLLNGHMKLPYGHLTSVNC